MLTSLGSFLDILVFTTDVKNGTSNETTFTFNTFAIKIQEIDTNNFNGQTFIVNLGPFEQARNLSLDFEIDKNTLVTINNDALAEDKNFQNSTASLQLTSSIIEGTRSYKSSLTSSKRVNYMVFLKDSLFLPEDRTSIKVGSIIVAVRTSHHVGTQQQFVRVNFSINEKVICSVQLLKTILMLTSVDILNLFCRISKMLQKFLRSIQY